MILLDTHVLIWLVGGNERLGKQTRILAEQAIVEGRLAVSAITFWEIAMLCRRKRIDLQIPVSVWRQLLLTMGLQEISVTGEIGVLSAELDNFHPDPADRIITATALIKKAELVTADSLILKWQGNLKCYDARY